MIKPLDITCPAIRAQVIALQRRSYLVEAQLIDYFKIPGLIEEDEDLAQTEEVFYGYWEGERLVGALSFKLEEGLLDIYRLVVCPDYFGRGIATALVAFIEHLDLDFNQVIVGTAKANRPACSLYAKLGFNLVSEREVAPGLTIVQFSKVL